MSHRVDRRELLMSLIAAAEGGPRRGAPLVAAVRAHRGLGRVASREDRDDVAQDVALRLLAHAPAILRRIEGRAGHSLEARAYAYVARMIANRHLDARRAQARLVPIDGREWADTGPGASIEREAWAALERALEATLPRCPALQQLLDIVARRVSMDEIIAAEPGPWRTAQARILKRHSRARIALDRTLGKLDGVRPEVLDWAQKIARGHLHRRSGLR